MDRTTRLDDLAKGNGWPDWAKRCPHAYLRYLSAHQDLRRELESAGAPAAVIDRTSVLLAHAWTAGAESVKEQDHA